MMIAASHLEELQVALDPGNPKNIAPPELPPGQRILDIGCGAGQTLIAFYPDRISFGIDLDRSALRLGRTITDRVRFTQARGEQLPFAGASFDAVIARVSLPYMNIEPALREMRRVLVPGGLLWLALHPFRTPWKFAKRANLNGRIRFGYIVVNSVLFHLGLPQFAFLGEYESFQTVGGMRRCLKRAGFESVTVELEPHYVVAARVPTRVAL